MSIFIQTNKIFDGQIRQINLHCYLKNKHPRKGNKNQIEAKRLGL